MIRSSTAVVHSTSSWTNLSLDCCENDIAAEEKYNKINKDDCCKMATKCSVGRKQQQLTVLLLGVVLVGVSYVLICTDHRDYLLGRTLTTSLRKNSIYSILLDVHPDPGSVLPTVENDHANKNTNKATTTKSISWTMHPVSSGEPYEERFSHFYHCQVGDERNRVDLEPSVKSKVWFRTDIQTNLNILVMGDSVAMQIGELLQEAIGIPQEQRTLLRMLYPQCSNEVPADIRAAKGCIPDEDEKHQSLFWGRSPQGGGAGGWRILHWWLRRNAGKPLPEAPGGGWALNDTTKILNSIVNFAPKKTYAKRSPKVDVLVFRVSQPWMSWRSMTPNMMNKTIEVAREQLDVNVVIFVTIPFANNIANEEDVQQMHATNDMIRQFARDYPTSPGRLERMTVLTWDLAQFNDALVQNNARQMGYTVQDPYDFRFGLNTLYRSPEKSRTYTKSIGQICAPPAVPHQSGMCIHQNMITVDGQHICLQTFGGRMMAGLACVIRCATTYGTSTKTHHHHHTDDRLQNCEEACNEHYMSLNDLDTSFFVDSA